MTREYRVDEIILSGMNDHVLRTIKTDYGGARQRSGHYVQGVRLIITKDGEEHMTVMQTPEDVLRLARNLLTQVALWNHGRS